MTAPIIFLDIDGVLNSDAFYDRLLAAGEPIPRPPIDREAVARLERIVQATGAEIVLSTSWRGHPDLPRWLVERGCSAEVVGMTPVLRGDRGREIAAWLRRNRFRRNPALAGPFAILDDGDDVGALAPWLVRTTPELGLQDGHVDRAIALLGGAR